jgi:hypothetical protein
MKEHHYHEINPASAKDVETAIVRNDPEELRTLVVGVALHFPDADLAAQFCRRLARHLDGGVRGNAILGFGHLARRFRTLPADIQRIIEAGLSDPSRHVRRQSEAAAADAAHFLGWNIQRAAT